MSKLRWLAGWMMVALCWPVYAQAGTTVQTVEADGLSAWLVENNSVPMVELRLFFADAGVVSDPADKQGRAALATAMLLEGAGTRDARAFHEMLERHAIEMDVSAGRDALQISVRSLSEHVDVAMELLGEALTAPRFDEAALAKVKRRMDSQRARQEESPSYHAMRLLHEAAYPNHPYSQARLGSAESVAALTPEDLHAFTAQRLAKNTLIIAAAGDLSAERLQGLIATHLADLPAQAQPLVVEARPFNPPKELLHYTMEKPQTFLLFARAGIDRNHPDFYAAYVLNHLLGGGSTLISRLGVEVREKRGLTYGIDTYLDQDAYSARWVGALATQHETQRQAKEVIEQTLAQMQQRGVSAAELYDAKRYITGSFPLNIDSNAQIASYLIAMQRFQLGTDYLAKRNGYFEAVSLEAVNRLASAWLHPEDWGWVRVGVMPTAVGATGEPSHE